METRTRVAAGLVLALLLTTPATHAENRNVDGRWTGTTQCPLGATTFTVEVEGDHGVLGHGGYGPQQLHPERFPIKVRSMTGWEGEWIYFRKADPGYASFSDISGLLSPDERSMTVKGIGMGDCQELRLSRAAAPDARRQPSPTVRTRGGPAVGREPTEAEMRSALEYAFHGDADALHVDNPVNGGTFAISDFRKTACVRAQERPGYYCDYQVSLNARFRSNEGTADGAAHAGAMQQLWKIITAGQDPGGQATGRFVYDVARGRWIRFNE